MTLLSVVRDVCATVGVLMPSSVFSNISSNRTMQEMLSLANETAQRIAYNTRDWQRLRTTQTVNGDGATAAFALPSNFKRMLLTSNVWRSTDKLTPMRFILDTDEWLNRRARDVSSGFGEWTLLGGQIVIAPVLAADQTAYYPYLDKNCIALASGGQGDSFQDDFDGYALDERVLKLGMIWTWKSQKGTPYQEDLGTYNDALDYQLGRDAPSPIFIGHKPLSAAARGAPFSVLMP